MKDPFRNFAARAAMGMASPYAFMAALGAVLVWAVLGPFLGFSEIWQLAINTGTTIVTFLTVFLLQNTQVRDTRAIHLKLDELVRSSSARNLFVDLEHASEAEIERFEQEIQEFRRRQKNDREDTLVE